MALFKFAFTRFAIIWRNYYHTYIAWLIRM
jgi:hypothetical protein